MSETVYAQYATAQRLVTAVQVTEENMVELAGWAKGDVKTEQHGDKTVPYVKINVQRMSNPRFGKAYVGDWLVGMGKAKMTFRVYSNDAFHNSFDSLYDTGTPIFDEIYTELKKAQALQIPVEATAHKLSKIAKDYADGAYDISTQETVTPTEIMGRPYVTIQPTPESPFEVVGEGVVSIPLEEIVVPEIPEPIATRPAE